MQKNKILRKKIDSSYEIIGQSPEITKIKEMIEKIAVTDARVLIMGENGTGKELVAHWIHQKSNRYYVQIFRNNQISQKYGF